ncbi:hypothetical protein QFC22_000340 [Naganishia vaughanmartiniae]|uniref:Uncharacterized protein n=1 Tax=Naganishia vaughanmartiniae TaxID=1424756 RepID=A0ACC2XMU1_9TREE|nr:hypothetical protein QFC22_000340 [Naganishia vaughanmartiniae]
MSTTKTVLVTGISGFVATHVALRFLENGWNVRGTVRSDGKAKKVADLACFKPYSKQLSFSIVEDLVSGDFSESVKDVDAVAHTASPFHMAGKDWHKDYKNPAVEGTKNVLEAAQKNPSIKHVVVTSSFASIGDFSKPATEQAGKTYTEEDWNPLTNDYCESLKADDPTAGGTWYTASKKFAELAAWDIAKKASFKLSTICPPMIFGPPIHYVSSLDALNTSSAAVYALMKPDGSSTKEVPETQFPAYADVRDVATAHYETVARDLEGRYLICNGAYDNQHIVDLIRKEFPEIKARTAEGKPGEYLDDKVFRLDASKSKKDLGIKYHSFDDCFKDTVKELLAIEKRVNA